MGGGVALYYSSFRELNDVAAEEKRTKAMGVLSIIIGTSAALSFAIGPAIHKYIEVNEMFLYCAIIVFISLLFIIILLKESKLPKDIKKSNKGEEISYKKAIKVLLNL